MSLKVSVFLRDTGKFSDKLSIAVLNGKTMTVNLLAIGAGTSIVFNPEIFPIFDMGCLFRYYGVLSALEFRLIDI